MRRIEIALMLLTGLFAVAGLALWVWQPPLPLRAAKPERLTAAAPRVDRRRSPVDNARNAAAIVNSNMFSVSRAAPRVRYTPPGADESGVMSDAMPAAQPPAAVTPLPQLFGTTTGPAGASALLQPDSAGASGRLYREGDQVGPYRIIKINSGSVIVRGPGGRHELKVQTREPVP